MSDFANKVVAITGAASGLGRGMAARFAQGGARLALADRHAALLFEFADELMAGGAEVTTAVLDVRDADAVAAFADATFAAYGEVDYSINSAGMSSMGSIFKLPLTEWRMLFDINVMGLVHGVRAFVPRMIAQNRECHVVNVASNAGLQCRDFLPGYFMSKHAAVSLTESLAIELQTIKSQVKAYVFCPGLVRTPLSYNSSELRGADEPYYQTEEFRQLSALGKAALAAGMPLEEAMDGFFAGLEADDFYIRTHPAEEKDVEYRAETVLSRARPVPIPAR
jgi:NADP-dependent 3-hydroxy acid dehydrogenase YdfG